MKTRIASLARVAFVAALLFAATAPARAATPSVPNVALERLRIERLGGREAQLAITLSIENAGDRDIALNAVEMNVELAHVPVGTASLSEPVVLSARARTSATFHGTASSDALAAALVTSLDRRDVEYAIAGIAQIDGGIVPFAERGHKSLAELLDRR